MVFSSLFFLYVFLPLCLIAYQFPQSIRGKNVVLLIFSLLFYAWGEPLWVVQLLLSGFTVYLFGRAIAETPRDPGLRKALFGLGVVVALIPLLLFKYAGFFVENLNGITGLKLAVPELKMPIGISFYTFQILSYLVDLYRGRCQVQTSFFRFLLYESLFPQLIAGPIVRYADVETEMSNRKTEPQDWVEGGRRFLVGLAKKTLLANGIAAFLEQTLSSGHLDRLSVVQAWIGLLAFTFQIYLDFSAYSDMAIGLGRLFGFHFKENFNYPYCARSITDFWRRWHISLSSFFRDYVYIPMGGNQRHQIINLFVVWSLTGLWHGASWNFVLWGLYYFLFLVLEKFVFRGFIERLPAPITVPFVGILVSLGWALFYFTNLPELGLFLQRLFGFGGTPWINLEGRLLLRQAVPFLVICWFASMPWAKKWCQKSPIEGSLAFQATPLWVVIQVVWMGALLFLSTASLAGASFNPFLYFRF